MYYPAYLDRYKPKSKLGLAVFDVSVVLSASLFIALFSQLEFFVPFSPVPVTGQTFAVLLTGLVLGKAGGASAVLAYLLEGSIGLPFFSGGSSGVRHFFSPSGGYLIGFIAAAFLAGCFAEAGWHKNRYSLMASLAVANLSVYLFGLSWLAIFVRPGMTLQLGLYPFLFGDLIKILVISLSLPFFMKKAGSEMPPHGR
jgi:biotin transport system substrate-specific component